LGDFGEVVAADIAQVDALVTTCNCKSYGLMMGVCYGFCCLSILALFEDIALQVRSPTGSGRYILVTMTERPSSTRPNIELDLRQDKR